MKSCLVKGWRRRNYMRTYRTPLIAVRTTQLPHRTLPVTKLHLPNPTGHRHPSQRPPSLSFGPGLHPLPIQPRPLLVRWQLPHLYRRGPLAPISLQAATRHSQLKPRHSQLKPRREKTPRRRPHPLQRGAPVQVRDGILHEPPI